MACVAYVRRPIPISKRGVSEFLTVESYSPTEIHRRLRSVYGQDATDVSSVGHWQQAYTSHCSETETEDEIDALIRDDHRIRISEMCDAIELETGAYGHQKTWLQKSMRKVGQPEKHLCRTTPAQ